MEVEAFGHAEQGGLCRGRDVTLRVVEEGLDDAQVLGVADGPERPGCGRTHWIIGRISAECAFCATALPLAETGMRSDTAPVIIQHKNRGAHAWAA